MIVWVDGAHDPAENMRRDTLLLAAAERGAEPVLRLFQFAPHGITLGASQDPGRELDLERCRSDGVPWAVRPTGGRAIFHAEEWTYALASPIGDPAWGGTRDESYLRASGRVAASLRRLGVPASLQRPGTPASPEGSPATRAGDRPRAATAPAAPCFASAARHEVTVEGRKLVGSAQRRTATGLLQQGSVLLGEGHLRLADYLRVRPDAREPIRAELAFSTRPAGEWLPPSPALSLWAEALLAELPPGTRVLEGAHGLFLLTLENPAPYTAAVSQTTE